MSPATSVVLRFLATHASTMDATSMSKPTAAAGRRHPERAGGLSMRRRTPVEAQLGKGAGAGPKRVWRCPAVPSFT
jgi:hypothetical protein